MKKTKHQKSKNVSLRKGINFSFLFLFFLFLLTPLSAQNNKTIKGVVTDAKNEPLPGVAVTVKGTTHGVHTDLDGTFALEVDDNAALEVTYAGYVKKVIPVAGKTQFNIVLQEDQQLLKEVVVVGYGTMERRAVTSAISSVKGSDLMQGMGGSTIATALQGKVSGLTISGTSSPNSSNSFQLRGVGSVNASKEPLIVIDGIPGGDIRSLNQEDILTIDVLKDASAGAIYGTRAAAGVILITTKQGEAQPDGHVKLTYTGEFSTESVRKRPEVLTAQEFKDYGRAKNEGNGIFGGDTDWYDELLNKNPFSHKQVVNVSGGSKYATVYATFSTQNQVGIVINDKRKDYSGRINANFKLLDNFLEIKTHAEYRQADRTNNTPNFNQALKADPTRPVYNKDDKYGTGYNIWTGAWEDFNPVADSNLKNNGGLDKWTAADATMKLNFTPEFSSNTTIGFDNRQWEEHKYSRRQVIDEISASRTGTAYLGFSKTENISFDSYLSYIKTIGDHNLGATAGYSFFEANGENWNMQNRNFPVDAIDVWDMNAGTYLSDGKAEMKSEKNTRERLLAFFGRINYSYDDRYMMTASLRHEGSSKFGKNNRWGDFWALSGGWRVSKESFMKDVSFVTDLKLRLGYGITGNNGFKPGKSTLMYGSDQWWLINGEWVKTFGSTHTVNPDLKWEEKRELDFGIDYAFLDNRLYGKFDIYKRLVSGMLFEKTMPQPPYVHDKMTANLGDLENQGWEFEIGADIVRGKDFNYSTTMRFSHNTTKMKSMGDASYEDKHGMPSPGSPGDAVRIQPGERIGQFFLWRFAGFDKDGQWLVYNKDNEVILAKNKTMADKAFIGNAIPKLIMAWDHTFSYKNWDASIYLHSWIDFDVFNTIDMYYGLNTQGMEGKNLLTSAYGKYKDIKGEKELTDFWLHDGTFLKIDAINIGYNLNLKKYWKYLDKGRFYLTVRDIATFTKYDGLNPEVDINGLEPGFEMFNSIYPQTRRFTLGVQLTF